jgi:hypothetical protein
LESDDKKNSESELESESDDKNFRDRSRSQKSCPRRSLPSARALRYRSNSIERSKEHNYRSFQVDNICILFLEYLQGQTNELHIDIRRIGINEIPSETNEQISNWLYQRFSLKDK